MLRNGQMEQIVQALLARAGASVAWDAGSRRFACGPEVDERLRGLSSGEAALVALARCVWNPSSHCDLGPILKHVDDLRLVGEAISALRDAGAADRWIERWGGKS